MFDKNTPFAQFSALASRPVYKLGSSLGLHVWGRAMV